MRRCLSMAIFGLLVGLVAQASEPGIPLESTSQELRALRSKQAGGTDENSSGKLRDVLPQMQAPVPGAMPLEPPAVRKPEANPTKKNKSPDKNWLIEGVGKLEKEAQVKNRGTAPDLADEGHPSLNEDDPDDLLTLYAEQKTNSEAKEGVKKQAAVRNDPFQPFLQGWLTDSHSQGREKFLDNPISKSGSRPEANGVGPIAPELQDTPGSRMLPETSNQKARPNEAAISPIQANPYLESMAAPLLPEIDLRSDQFISVPSSVTSGRPLLVEPNPRAEAPDRKVQLPAQTDDKKYFPQLKKF